MKRERLEIVNNVMVAKVGAMQYRINIYCGFMVQPESSRTQLAHGLTSAITISTAPSKFKFIS